SLVSTIDEDRRRVVHGAIARDLLALGAPPHDRLARHFAAAGEMDRASEHAVVAAELAMRSLAFGHAADLYGFAIAHGAHATRVRLLEPHAEALAAAGRYEAAAQAFATAAESSTGDEARDLRRRAADCVLYAGRIDAGLAMLGDVASDLGVQIP